MTGACPKCFRTIANICVSVDLSCVKYDSNFFELVSNLVLYTCISFAKDNLAFVIKTVNAFHVRIGKEYNGKLWVSPNRDPDDRHLRET